MLSRLIAMKFTVYSQTIYDLQIGNVIWPSDEYLVSQISSNNNTRSHHYNAFNLDLGSVDTNTLHTHVYIMTTVRRVLFFQFPCPSTMNFFGLCPMKV